MNITNYKTVVTTAAVFFWSFTAVKAQKEHSPFSIPIPGPLIRIVPKGGLVMPPTSKSIKPGIYSLPPDNMPCVVPDLRMVVPMPVQPVHPLAPKPR